MRRSSGEGHPRKARGRQRVHLHAVTGSPAPSAWDAPLSASATSVRPVAPAAAQADQHEDGKNRPRHSLSCPQRRSQKRTATTSGRKMRELRNSPDTSGISSRIGPRTRLKTATLIHGRAIVSMARRMTRPRQLGLRLSPAM